MDEEDLSQFGPGRPVLFVRRAGHEQVQAEDTGSEGRPPDNGRKEEQEEYTRVAEAVSVPLPPAFPQSAHALAQEPASPAGAEALENPTQSLSTALTRGSLTLLGSWWQQADRICGTRKHMSWVARMLLALYFINLVAEQVEVWLWLANAEPQRRWSEDPVQPYTFPFVWALLVLPAAIAVGAGVKVLPCAGVLLAACLLQDAYLVWRQTVNVIWHGARPNELIVKRLAVTGAALLVLADAVRAPKLKSFAGLLFASDAHDGRVAGIRLQMAVWRSALLLVARLALSALLLFSGAMQVLRVKARGTLWASPHAAHPYGVPDSHDNTWQLIQLALAIPLAFGWKTRLFCRALAVVLLSEAVTCWPPWSRAWPSWWYSAHVRLHFFTNAALSGALMLLQSSGPGAFAVDELLTKQE